MNNDDRPKFSVVSNDGEAASELGALTDLVLDERDGSPDFMAGFFTGAIVTQLQQTALASMEFDQLHPMPAAKSHLSVVGRVADYFKASVKFEVMSDDAEMVWCSFSNKRATIHVVPFPHSGKKNE
jgi:hypothetical protein